MYHVVLLAVLWATVFVVSAEQRREFKEFITHLYDIHKKRKHLKNTIRIYTHLYGSTESDYLRGYYYGKVGGLTSELKEVKYFGTGENI